MSVKFYMTHDTDNLSLFTGMVGATLLSTTSSNPVELFPMSAGITGALLSAWLSIRDGQSANRSQVALSFVSGVSAALFLSPVLVNHVIPAFLPPPDISSRVVTHLVIGLLGSTIIDKLWDMRKRIVDTAARKTAARWMGEVSTVEATKVTKVVTGEETKESEKLPVSLIPVSPPVINP